MGDRFTPFRVARLALFGFAAAALTPCLAWGVIISDNFSEYASSPTILGTSPSGVGNVNAPGGVYVKVGNTTSGLAVSTSTGNASPSVSSSGAGLFQADLALSLATNVGAGYTKPTVLTVSADLSPGTSLTVGNSSAERGIGIGFNSALNNGDYTSNGYTGFVLDHAGVLALVNDTSTGGNFPATSVAAVQFAGGTFNPEAFYTLTYTVNTVTGFVSNVSLSGSTANYNAAFGPSAVFQDSQTSSPTAYLELYSSSASADGSTGYIDNVVVTPEPASLSLLGIAAIALTQRRRSK